MKGVLLRLLDALVALIAVSAIAFALVRWVPGGPFDSERAPASPEIEQALRDQYHLDEPLFRQYARFLVGALQGDLGVSMKYRDHTVMDIVRQGAPVTLTLGGMAFVVAVGVGTPLGRALARGRGQWWGRVGDATTIGLICSPPIIVGPILLAVFAVWLGWAPVGLWESPAHFVLPTLTLGLFYVGRVAQLSREATLESMGADYARVALGKGLAAKVVFRKHLFPDSVAPVLAFSPPLLADLLTGSFVVENLFRVPGIGVFLVNSSLNRDYPMVVGLAVLYAAVLLALGVVADLARSSLDPRLKR